MIKQSCPFCSPDQDDQNSDRILKMGKQVYVMLSSPRLMPGHLLIIPKRHVEQLSELTLKERGELFEITIEFQEKILGTIAAGCDLRQNFRPFQKEDGIKVNHLHIHLLPRDLYDNLYQHCQIYEKEIFKTLSAGEAKEMTAKLC